MKLLLHVLTLFLILSSATAQDEPFPCATDQINSELFHKHPELQSGIINATKKLEKFTQEYIQRAPHERGTGTYIIPVVFHVIHDYGEGNISNAQIHDAVRLVNQQYRHLIPDSADIVNEFKSLAADTEIEIRLAQLDPDGNCTSGITRTYSSLTNIGDHQVKDLIQWPSDKYLNVYVCNAAAGLAGHALLPGAADTIPKWDGIVMQHTYIGSIGTSNHFKRTVLSHEIGHFLNLQHIWGGNNVPDFYYLPVAEAGNCAHDDGVADTPLTVGWQSCSLSGTSCGTLDMVQNYMDYSYCSLLFTEGQKQRMHAALNSSVANRNNLWSPSNLLATGVAEGVNHLCQTEIDASQRVICAGESITFTDLSFHGITNRTWTFQGGSISSSTDSSVTVTFNTAGTYDVSLSISNGVNTIDSVYSEFIHVLEDQPTASNIIENFEDITVFENLWYPTVSENSTRFERVNYGKNSAYSIYVNNFDGPQMARYTLESKPIDATLFTEIAVTFDLAFAKMSTSLNENIQIQLSKDCGKTWTTKRQINLNSNFSLESDAYFFPDHDSLWINIERVFAISNYKVNNLMIRLLFHANSGNNLYIDNINCSDISELSLSIETIKNNILVYPNPANDQLMVSVNPDFINGQIQLFDVFGKRVLSKSILNKKEVAIDLTRFSEGTYFLNYIPKDSKSNYTVQKVIIAR